MTLTRRLVLGLALCAALPALAEDNPLGLIDPAVISVGTMGDAKPYAFTTADGSFTGFIQGVCAAWPESMRPDWFRLPMVLRNARPN